ncbi:hypothetical protein G5786_000603 [Listeria monocytogenes]|uniref:Uncharacterized protein n=3 Tax=Listeria monocytogenes TaxID=1639 RepID=A0A5L0ZCJ3_LISMN|nr:hypothetical protein [Listeria monocytogenes]EHC6203868.1 hypothetical protein [Listeria monocytogenes serotype 1/2a]EAF7062095.1 hypothetical protein [Listeria monocytogenes]EAG1320151.1 hypothetical protein [Listeria monocytogenes]EAG5553945.1 hypothetical protein [Listeria monocytogenes]
MYVERKIILESVGFMIFAYVNAPSFMRVFFTICSLFILCGPSLLAVRYLINKKQFKNRDPAEEEKMIEAIYEKDENGKFPWEIELEYGEENPI